MNIEEFKETCCKYCKGYLNKMCCDLDRNLLDEQVKACMKIELEVDDEAF